MWHATRFLALVLMLLAAACGGSDSRRVSDYTGPRTAIYFANGPEGSLDQDLSDLETAVRKGYVTHVIVGLFHTHYRHDGDPTSYSISLGGTVVDDPSLVTYWSRLDRIHRLGVKMLASFGGGGVGDFKHLLDPSETAWYPEMRKMLQTYKFDGVDLDIEDQYPGTDVINTAHLRQLLTDLRNDFGQDFLITAAPGGTDLIHPLSVDSLCVNIDSSALMAEGWFNWYNVQMYNGFGAPTEAYFKILLEKNPNVPASRFVVGFLTAKSAGDGNTCRALGDIKTALSHLVSSHPDAGGAFGWNFHACEVTPYGDRNPVEWLHGVHDSMANPIH